jgi:hypothetical protein
MLLVTKDWIPSPFPACWQQAGLYTEEAVMARLLASATRFILLCGLLLVLPAIAAAQPSGEEEDVWMLELPKWGEAIGEEADTRELPTREETIVTDEFQSGKEDMTAAPLLESTSPIPVDGTWTVRDENMRTGDFFTGTFTWDVPFVVEFTITDLAVVTDPHSEVDPNRWTGIRAGDVKGRGGCWFPQLRVGREA